MEENKKSNTIALIGFMLSFFFGIIGLIFSIIGLKKSKELNGGKCFSIAGIVISSIKIALGILLISLFILVYYYRDRFVVEENHNTKEIFEIIDRNYEDVEYENIIKKDNLDKYTNDYYWYILEIIE